MQYRILGRTGLKVSVVGFGGIPIMRISESESAVVINRALELGINFFDTARAYTDSEAKLGAVLGKRRDQVIIATKTMSRTAEGMAADIKKSLETMALDYIDLYQLHNLKDRDEFIQAFGPGGALEALKQAQKEGLVRHIGITGHIRSFLVEALKTGAMETVQFPFNAVEAAGAEELLDLAAATGTGVIVMKPLAGGSIRDTGLALRFILEHPVSTVIPGMDAPGQVDQNAAVGADLRPLTETERKKLEEMAAKLGTTFCRRCEYCQPCPQGVDIPSVFLLDGYFTRYELQDWARERYQGMKVTAQECVECGECEEKCPYNLPIRAMLAEAKTRLG
ncbi:MAG TPA: aldo/keto reductase [Desulfotomaculum sp.]|nr:MAG: aldo/keto reductase [Desulfotomaculum sp. BICA1-6]HBX24407.1 aldo/keto reductase [Desulfotomaculum sp.]